MKKNCQKSTGRTVAVVANHGLGDLLMTLPLLRNIDCTLDSNENIIVLCKNQLQKQVLNSLKWNARIEILLASKGILKSYLSSFANAIKLRARQPSHLFAPMMNDSIANAAWLRLIGASYSIGPSGSILSKVLHDTVPRGKTHKVDYSCQLGVVAGFNSIGYPDTRIAVTPELRRQAKILCNHMGDEGTWIAFAPGTGIIEKHKRWPVDNYAKLGRMLLEDNPNLRIALIGSKEEEPLLRIIERSVYRFGRCKIIANQDFSLTLAVISRCTCLVGGCTGTAHMAAAVGTPVVGLYGPTNPCITGPYGTKFWVVRCDLPCSPCYRLGFTSGCARPLCMTLISPERVNCIVMKILHGYDPPPIDKIETPLQHNHHLKTAKSN